MAYIYAAKGPRSGGSASRPGGSRVRKRRRLHVEALEDRALLAVDLALATDFPPGSPLVIEAGAASTGSMALNVIRTSGTGSSDDNLLGWQVGLSIVPDAEASGTVGFNSLRSGPNYVLGGPSDFFSTEISTTTTPNDTAFSFDVQFPLFGGVEVPTDPGAGLLAFDFVASAGANGTFGVYAKSSLSLWSDAAELTSGHSFDRTDVKIGEIRVANDAVPVEFDVAGASDLEASGGNTPILVLRGDVTSSQTIDVTVTGGTASDGTDFSNTTTVTIPTGSYDGTSATGVATNLSILDDTTVEADETIGLTLSNPSPDIAIGDANINGTIQSTHTYTILNDDFDDFVGDDFETGDLSKFPWQRISTPPGHPWVISTPDEGLSSLAHRGLYSAQAGEIDHNQSTTLEVTLTTGAGDISFWRKVSSEAHYDFLKFYIDGTLQQQWAGELDWAQTAFAVSAGNHTFSWQYEKDGSVSHGAGTAWIDDIVFPPVVPDTTAPTVERVVPAPGTTVVSSSTAAVVTFSEPVQGVDASDLELSGTATGAATVGTPTDQGGNTWQFPITGLGNGTLQVSLAPDGGDIEDAAGNDLPRQTWSYDVYVVNSESIEHFETADFSRFPWQRRSTPSGHLWGISTPTDSLSEGSEGGLYSARAGTLAHNQSSTLEVTLTTGAGDLSFWRKVSSEARYDFLKFSIDGALQQQWAGELDWAQVSFTVPAGTHTFSWEYAKDGRLSRGSDTAWIDDIVFPPVVPDTIAPTVQLIGPAPDSTIPTSSVNVAVTFSEPVQGVDATDVVLSGTSAGAALVGTPSNLGGTTWQFPITGLVDGGLNVSLAPDANDIEDLAGNDLANQTWSYTVAVGNNVEDFETADFSKFAWEHDSTPPGIPWVISTPTENVPSLAHGGLYSARAGAISHSQSTTLEVTRTTTAGDISFWRKVSSEAHYDFLRFYIDGVLQDQWAGELDWAEVEFAVPAGTHTFSWEYAKDQTDSYGSDTAWIDDIVFTAIEAAVPTSERSSRV